MKTIIVVAFVTIWGYMIMNSLEHVTKSQDVMLCNSAKVSGNIEYQVKCDCFYNGNDIACINKK